MSEELLQQALVLYRNGKKQAAIEIMEDLINKNPAELEAWYGLGFFVEDPRQKAYCFYQVIKLKPDHLGAKQFLMKLKVPYKEALAPFTINPPRPQQHLIKVKRIDSASFGEETPLSETEEETILTNFLPIFGVAVAVVFLFIMGLWFYKSQTMNNDSSPTTVAAVVTDDPRLTIATATTLQKPKTLSNSNSFANKQQSNSPSEQQNTLENNSSQQSFSPIPTALPAVNNNVPLNESSANLSGNNNNLPPDPLPLNQNAGGLPLEIVSLPEGAKANSSAAITVKTIPGTTVNLRLTYNMATAPFAIELPAQQADANGQITWTWQIDSNALPEEVMASFTANLNQLTNGVTTFFTLVN